MAILVTGGTAKTSMRLGGLLQDANIPFLMAARRPDAVPSGLPSAKFDWANKGSWSALFKHQFPGGEPINAVYLIAPTGTQDPTTPVNNFIDYALKEHGVKRFVLCSGGSAEPDGPMAGKIWQHLIDLGVEHSVLRPTWFMDNLSEGWHVQEINADGKMHTATGDGKIPFVSANTIAAVAFALLTASKIEHQSPRVSGPELLTYDEVAAKLTKALGRKTEHVKLSGEERKQKFLNNGLPEPLADFLVMEETNAANGDEERKWNDDVQKVTGKKGQTFDDWVEETKAVWQ